MNADHVAPPFPTPIIFPDIDADELAREEDSRRAMSRGSWEAYLRRVLPSALQAPEASGAAQDQREPA